MIATQIQVHNIRDAEGFVAQVLRKSGVRLSGEEKQEMLAEGVTILFELARDWRPRLEGYASEGTFSGYAGFFLPKRLQDAYYRLHPEHQVRRTDDGRKVREFGLANLSLHHDDMREPIASMYLGPAPEDLLPACPTGQLDQLPWAPSDGTAAALSTLPAEYRLCANGIVKYMECGLGTDEIAARMRMNRREVSKAQSAIGSALWAQLRSEAA